MKRTATSPLTKTNNSKQHRADEKSSNVVDEAKMISSELLKNVADERSKIFQCDVELQQTNLEIELVNEDRKIMQKERAYYHQELFKKNAVLAEAEEKLNAYTNKMKEVKEKTQRFVELKREMAQRIETTSQAVEVNVREHHLLRQRTGQAVVDARRMRENIQETLEKANQEFAKEEEELENMHRHHQALISERRGEWKELTDSLEIARHQAVGLRAEIESNQKQLDEIQGRTRVIEREMVGVAERTAESEKKFAIQHQFANGIKEFGPLKRENHKTLMKLECTRSALRMKILEAKMERETTEKELAHNKRRLADQRERLETDRNYQREKVMSIRVDLGVKRHELETLEAEAQSLQNEEKAKREELEKRQQERLDLQRKTFDNLKCQLQSMFEEKIESNGFQIDASAFDALKAKMREEKERLLSDIELAKKRQKEKNEKLIADEKKILVGTPTKTPTMSLSQPAGTKSALPIGRKSEASRRCVTFKNTPVFYDPPLNSSTASQRPSMVVPRPLALPAPAPKPFPLPVPVLPSIIANPNPRTPSPKNQIALPMAPNSKSAFKNHFVASQWSDSSGGSTVDKNPRLKAILRKPVPPPKNTIPDFLGLF